MYVTGRLPLLVALGVLPVVALSMAGVDAWAAVGGWVLLCALAAGADAALAADPRALHVTRGPQRRMLLHTRGTATLVVRNTGTRALRGLLRDGWQPTAGAPRGRIAVTVPAGASASVDVPLFPHRRGRLRSKFVVVRAAGPWGIAGRQARIDAPGSVDVLPPFTARRHLPSRLARLRELDGATSVLLRGAGTEFDSLRPYVRGDDVRSIDWRATARAGATMLRTWRPERDRHVVVVIDTGRTSAVRVGDGVRLDAEMEATLLLAALTAQAGDHLHVLLFDRTVRARVSGVDGDALLPTLVSAMADVEPTLIDTDWDAAFAQVRALTVRPALVVLLTAQDDPDAARAFLGSLPTASAQTHVMVGTATDAGLADQTAQRGTIGEVYRAAAAEQSLADAGRVAAAISRAGAQAIADSPEALPARIADGYLQLKAAGRL